VRVRCCPTPPCPTYWKIRFAKTFPGVEGSLQLFALDTTLAPKAGDSYATLTQAMQGHVLAEGGRAVNLLRPWQGAAFVIEQNGFAESVGHLHVISAGGRLPALAL
jgi:hypothetical protein